MPKNNEYFVEMYQNLNAWLEEMTELQKPRIEELLHKSKVYGKALEDMSEEKLTQFIDNLKYDLHDFYVQNQQEVKHSVYLGLLNETLWSNLAQLTDKSQVEWAELEEDFQHKGEYKAGDMIGFGELECTQCNEKTIISHLSEVLPCSYCGGEDFIRLALQP